jgi:hypothetical protein
MYTDNCTTTLQLMPVRFDNRVITVEIVDWGIQLNALPFMVKCNDLGQDTVHRITQGIN